MSGILAILAKFIVPLLSALPSLVQGIEALFHGTPKSGPTKWIAIEQALSQAIQMVATEVAQLNPSLSADRVAGSVARFTKAVNDAFVLLCNELGIFQHS
jgi:hypothetical protein